MKKLSAMQAMCTARMFRGSSLLVLLIVFLLLSAFPLTGNAQAAQITLSPRVVSVALQPGGSVTLPITASVEGAVSPEYLVSFYLTRVSGNFPPQGSDRTLIMTLNPSQNPVQASLRIVAPENISVGSYSATYKTLSIKSTEKVSASSLTINVQIEEQAACTEVPSFSEVAATQNVIHTNNNKQVSVDFSGTVESQDACTIEKAWYKLTDEYGELDGSGPLELDSDGRFAVAVPMIASRKGFDKDGRLYTITFMADNEAGTGASGEARVVVSHDNGNR